MEKIFQLFLVLHTWGMSCTKMQIWSMIAIASVRDSLTPVQVLGRHSPLRIRNRFSVLHRSTAATSMEVCFGIFMASRQPNSSDAGTPAQNSVGTCQEAHMSTSSTIFFHVVSPQLDNRSSHVMSVFFVLYCQFLSFFTVQPKQRSSCDFQNCWKECQYKHWKQSIKHLSRNQTLHTFLSNLYVQK